MATTFKPAAELELIERITHVECTGCGTRSDADAAKLIADGNEELDDLLTLGLACCDDPLPDWLIVSESPLFDDPTINGDYEIRRSWIDPVTWEYAVDHDLAERLGVTA